MALGKRTFLISKHWLTVQARTVAVRADIEGRWGKLDAPARHFVEKKRIFAKITALMQFEGNIGWSLHCLNFLSKVELPNLVPLNSVSI